MIEELRDKDFPPLLSKRMEAGAADRGQGRYYLTPPFSGGWSDQRLIAQPDILDVVARMLGGAKDFVLCQVGVDTPLGGGLSEMQEIHRDCGPLWDDEDMDEPPPYQLAVNFPLCDVLPAKRGTVDDLGPVEMHRGSHRWTVAQGQQALSWGGAECEPIYMRAGDVMIRDVRGLHRGTPNYGPHPRPVGVLGYSMHWLRRPEVGIRVPRDYLHNAEPRVKELLRFEEVVDAVGPYTGQQEKYGADTLQDASGGSFISVSGVANGNEVK